MIKGAIFDMDGLMFDTERLSTEGWIQAGIQMHVPITESFVARFRGTNIAYSRALCRQAFGEGFDYDKARAIRTAHVDQWFHTHGAPVKKGLFPLLNWLTAQGIPCAVASSTRGDLAESYLRQAGVWDYFSYRIFGNMVQKSKPDPEIFLKAAAGLCADISQCIVFEDSPNGILAGKAAGARVIAIPDQSVLSEELLDGVWACLPDLGAAAHFIEEHNTQASDHPLPMMKVTYIGHSGFLAELPQATLLFDYYTGRLPDIRPDKPVYIFSSHSHGDHYNPEIFRYKDQCSQIHYIFGSEIRERYFSQNTVTSDQEGIYHTVFRGAPITFLDPHTLWSDGLIRVQTLASTDLGVAFLMDIGGRRIFHAGDLNWWTWIGEETPEEYQQMTSGWKQELSRLQSLTREKPIDLAFMLLDPRQGERYDWGMDDFLKNIPAKWVLPMHSQGDYAIAQRYLAKASSRKYLSRLIPVQKPDETFYLS